MAELPGPFNAAVKEFREITKQNAERTAAAEKRREIKENLADEKLISNLKIIFGWGEVQAGLSEGFSGDLII